MGSINLGSAAVRNVPETGDASSSQVVLGNDSRLGAGGGVSDGDKGDITVSGSGATWTIDNGVVSTSKMGGDVTSAGKAILDDADAAAQRTTLGLGTAATQASSAFEASGAVSTHAAVTSGAHGISTYGATLVDDSDAATARGTLGLGSAAIQSSAAFEASGAVASHAAATSGVHGISAYGASLVDDADAAAARTTLGLGTAATKNAPASGNASSTEVVLGSDTRLALPMAVAFHAVAGTNLTWTNMPAAQTFFLGSHRHVVLADLTGMSECRLVVNKQGTAGASGAVVRLRYNSSAFSTVVGDYLQIGSSSVQVAINTTDAILDSGWVALASGAKGVVYLALDGTGGDGAADPQFGAVVAYFR